MDRGWGYTGTYRQQADTAKPRPRVARAMFLSQPSSRTNCCSMSQRGSEFRFALHSQPLPAHPVPSHSDDGGYAAHFNLAEIRTIGHGLCRNQQPTRCSGASWRVTFGYIGEGACPWDQRIYERVIRGSSIVAGDRRIGPRPTTGNSCGRGSPEGACG